MRKRLVLWLVVGTLAAIVIAGGAIALGVYRDARQLNERLSQAASHLETGRWDDAQASLAALAAESRQLDARLGGPLPRVFSLVPVAGRSIRTTRAVLQSSATASDVAVRSLPALRDQTFWRDGTLDFDALGRLRSVAAEGLPELQDAHRTVERSASWPLPGPVARARQAAIGRLESAVRSVEVATQAIDLSESVLGAAGERRYFIAFENPAELRGAGGYWGNYGVLVADRGKLRLGRFGRMGEVARYFTVRGPDWFEARYQRFQASTDYRQLATAPDFPTIAHLLEADLRSAEGIGPVDGTIALDPFALSALLSITGPIEVPSWPQPIDSTNVVKATLLDAYSYFPDTNDRIAFLGETTVTVWSRLLDSDITTRSLATSGLGRAVEEKHLRLHFARPQEQRLAEALGASGTLGDATRTIALVLQNLAPNKLDYFLDRRFDVKVHLHPDGKASGQASVTLANRASSSGEPQRHTGPYTKETNPAGWNKQLIRVYLPGTATILPGSPDIGIAQEQGFTVVEWTVEILSGQTLTRTVDFVTDHLWDPASGRLDLTVRKQASMNPDEVHLQLVPPRGWRVKLPEHPLCSSSAPVTTDIRVEADVRRWVPGWVLGPSWGDVYCTGRVGNG